MSGPSFSLAWHWLPLNIRELWQLIQGVASECLSWYFPRSRTHFCFLWPNFCLFLKLVYRTPTLDSEQLCAQSKRGINVGSALAALHSYLSSIITFTQSFVYAIIMIICYRVYNRKTQPGPNCLWVVCLITPLTSHYESTLKFMEKLKRLLW